MICDQRRFAQIAFRRSGACRCFIGARKAAPERSTVRFSDEGARHIVRGWLFSEKIDARNPHPDPPSRRPSENPC